MFVGIWCTGILLVSAVSAVEIEGPLVIVTSFPQQLFERYKQAFETQHPGIKVHIRSRKTSAAISFIQSRTNDPVDLFWASAPDAFEVLKNTGHLIKMTSGERITENIGNYPVDDPEGYYRGFAISGYGLMWNTAYFARHNLPQPSYWSDLTKAEYFRHVGISTPSRSGTTHLIVETILQSEGWEKGWATLLEMGGNLATVTARSFGVPDGIRTGRFGVGPVIDFFGLSAIAGGASVEFSYPEETTFLPANIAIVNRVQNKAAAYAFIEFIRSDAGQLILFEPTIRRLPVRSDIYRNAPEGYPNPFDPKLLDTAIDFDSDQSRKRYHLINTLFDIAITYRVKKLNRVWETIHKAEKQLSPTDPAHIRDRLLQARSLATRIPVSAAQALNDEFVAIFKHRKPGLPLPAKQTQLEHEWEMEITAWQDEAFQIARQVLADLSTIRGRR